MNLCLSLNKTGKIIHKNGKVKITSQTVSGASPCPKKTTQLIDLAQINIVGTAGVAGPQGPQGPAGSQGARDPR